MANTFPKRWTEAFQMRVAPSFFEDVDMLAAVRGLNGRAELIRALVDEEKARVAQAEPKLSR